MLFSLAYVIFQNFRIMMQCCHALFWEKRRGKVRKKGGFLTKRGENKIVQGQWPHLMTMTTDKDININPALRHVSGLTEDPVARRCIVSGLKHVSEQSIQTDSRSRCSDMPRERFKTYFWTYKNVSSKKISIFWKFSKSGGFLDTQVIRMHGDPSRAV